MCRNMSRVSHSGIALKLHCVPLDFLVPLYIQSFSSGTTAIPALGVLGRRGGASLRPAWVVFIHSSPMFIGFFLLFININFSRL